MAGTRREMLKSAALGGAALASGMGPAKATTGAPKILHQVFFWLKRSGSAEDREQLIAGLRALARIDVVRSLQIGVPASTEQREVVDSSFDVSELMIFDSVADQKVYQDHPLHQEFISKCEHLWGKVVVYDVKTV
jgi:hypothetical protein